MELMIVNPGRRGNRKYGRRRRATRVRTLSERSSVRRRRKKSAKPGKGTKDMARRYRRRNPAKKKAGSKKKSAKRSTKKKSTKKRSTKKKAAKKSTTKRKSAKRVAAGKKAAATRKRNKAAKKASGTKRKSPKRKSPKRKAAKKSTGTKKRKSAKRVAAGKKAAATRKRNKAAKKTSNTKRKSTQKRRKKAGRNRVSGAHAKWAYSSRKSYSKKRTRKGRRRATGARRVARAYLAVRRVNRGIERGSIKGGAAKQAQAMGLTRVNPAGKGIMGILKDAAQTGKALAIPALVTVGGMYGMSCVGMRISAAIAPKMPSWVPTPVAKNIVPISTGVVSLGAAMALRRLVRSKLPVIKMDGAMLAPWVAVGGLGAAFIMAIATTEWGKKLAAKCGLSLSVNAPEMAQAAAAGSGAAAAGLGSYVTVSQYLGAYGVDISPMGPSWYGRGDISPLGDYVDAGPQNMFGSYEASSYPVHAPGPGDNINVMAQLGDYDSYGQGGVFASGYGAAFPEGGYGALELEETPGGTMITMGEAGIFGGKGVL